MKTAPAQKIARGAVSYAPGKGAGLEAYFVVEAGLAVLAAGAEVLDGVAALLAA